MLPIFPDVCSRHGVIAQSRVQPETVTIFRHWTRLTTDNHGEISGEPPEGFFCAETQFLSQYRLRVNGAPIVHRLSAQLSPTEWACQGAVLAAGESGDLDEGTIPKGTLGVRILRKIDQGMTELITVRNDGQPRQKFDLRLTLTCPIRDVEFAQEMKQKVNSHGRGLRPRIVRRGHGARISFRRDFGPKHEAPAHGAGRVIRALGISLAAENSSLRILRRGLWDCEVEIRVKARLRGRQEARIELRFEPFIDGVRMPAPELGGLSPLPREAECPSAVQWSSGHSTLNLIVGQAQADLESLRLPVFGPEDPAGPGRTAPDLTAFIAGVPRYIGLFGRDTVITARQSALLAFHFLESSLDRLAANQGDRFDDWRDEEPDRMPHEKRLDPKSVAGKLNRDIYYGDVTSTPYWILALSTLFQWTGDLALLRRHRSTLERCCRWIRWRLEQGGGFIYYEPRAPRSGPANRNQAWKDSSDAIVDERGRVRVPPLALVEIQGYAYQALTEAAELLRALGSASEPAALHQAARELKERFHRAFFLEDGGYFALALDRRGQPIRTQASNVGHCLGTGILHPDTIPRVVRNLLAPDMFSGWGIRTLSTENPAFDPLSYHRGAVWPVENAIIAEGMASLGYREEANQIIGAQLSVAALFQHMRLPEAIGGQERSERTPVPGIYSFANLLQAWSVSAISQFLTTMLGLKPRLDLGKVCLDPRLPEWLPWVEVRDLRLGESRLELRAERSADGRTHWECRCVGGAIEIVGGRERWAA